MNEKSISEATPVRIGLVLAFLGIFGGSVWWASGVSSKLDTLIANQGAVEVSMSEMKTDNATTQKSLDDLTLRVAILEVAGKPDKKN